MRRPQLFVAVASALAMFMNMTVAGAQAQQGSVTSNRLMFDPSGLQGTESRKPAPVPAPQAITPAQNFVPQPPARQTAAPQPAMAPAATRAAPNPPARATASAPPRPAGARRPAQSDNADNRAVAGAERSAKPVPREQPGALGRLELPQGSVGFENRTQLNAYDLSDGRRVPGYDNIQRKDSSYFGLSLRLPTADSPSASGSSLSSPSFRDHGAN
jgi:hypothetical protein